MSKTIQEIYSGWLTKSPPTKRIWRGRWRRRWFVLHQGELPAQYTLSYFTDRNNHKLKGIIDLDQIEQIDVGLKFHDKKLKFDYMFAIKTPTRTYYLAAETEHEMKSWTKNICNICKMRATSDEEDCNIEAQPPDLVNNTNTLESPPISPVSTSPYIPISECITGKTPILPNQSLNDYNFAAQHVQSTYYRTKNIANNAYDMSDRTYTNCGFNSANMSLKKSNVEKKEPEYFNLSYPYPNTSPLQSPTDSESVFTDDDWSQNNSQSEQSFRNIRPSNSSAEVETTVGNKKTNSVLAPPRPPKPQHINNSQSSQSSYLNVQINIKGNRSGNHSKSNSTCEESNTPILTDETYDFPRSHVESADVRSTLGKRHCYNNAAPSFIDGHIFTYDNPSPKPSTSQAQIFKYGDEIGDEPHSPLSQTSSTAQYSNLPSPLLLPDSQLMPPPLVNRGLKPKRKLSDSVSVSSNTEPNSPRLAPSVDRKLKPLTTPTGKTFETDDENFNRKCRAAPSPTPFGRSFENLHSDENEQIYHYCGSLNDQRKKLEYLDLDLDNKSTNNLKQRTRSTNEDTSARSPGAITVYKKVDFMKTEAFNITRNNLEEERKKVPFKK